MQREYWRLSPTSNSYPTGIYLLKGNNRNFRTRCENCSKLTIKTLERCHRRHSGVFVVNFEDISHLILVFLNMKLPAGYISEYFPRPFFSANAINFERIFYLALVHLLLTLNRRMFAGLRSNTCQMNECQINVLTLFTMGLFGAAHRWGEQKGPFAKICHAYPTTMKLGSYILPKENLKNMSHVAHHLCSADISIFSPEIGRFIYIKKHRYGLHFGT